MKKILKKLPEIFLLVLLLSVVSFRSEKVFFKDNSEKSKTNEAKFKLEDAKEFFKGAESLKLKGEDLAKVSDSKGNKLGYLLSTNPLSDDIIGYAGTVPVLIAVDAGNIIQGIKLLPNVESPGFIKRIRKKGFFNSWDGVSVDSALVNEVDAISGASMTCDAVKAGIKIRLEKFADKKARAHKVDIMKILYYLGSVFVILLALLSFFYPAKMKKLRNVLLIASILILGFWQGNFISLALLYGWFINGVPLFGKIILISLVLLGVLLPLFLNKSFYCAYVCPFGAAQEFAGKIKKKKKPLPQKVMKVLKKARMVIFYLIILLIILGLEPDITEFEPFSAFLYNAATPWVISLAVIFLVLSIFIPRAWCNYFCPTGYLLDVFKKGKTFKK